MMKSDVLVIGSNMIDLITYIDRMPVEGETVEAPISKWDLVEKEPTRQLPPQDSAQK